MKKAFIINYALLAILFILSIFQNNNEFLLYAIILTPLVILLHKIDSVFYFPQFALWGFSIWLLLHILGGLTTINSTRLYDFIVIELVGEPYHILKYDQIIHIYCYVVMALLVGTIIKSIIVETASIKVTGAVIILAASGIGGVNEILEFLPVVLFNAPGPGGYTNTAIDLVANFIGASIGTWILLSIKFYKI